MRSEPTWISWARMRQRCNDPNADAYPWYGGRGIRVCARWQSYIAFVEDMGERPVGTTIDRIDADGNYEPSNCRWATRSVQARHCRKLSEAQVRDVRRLLGTMSQAAIARRFGVSQHAISQIKLGRQYNGVGL